MDNTNNPTEKPVASNTPSGQEQVSSVVPNGYKQRGNGSTFLVVMLIFLVLGGIVSFVYFKLDSSVGGFEDVGKQVIEFFEKLDDEFDSDSDSDSDGRTSTNIDSPDIDMPEIDLPEINTPSQSDMNEMTNSIYTERAKLQGFDTDISMGNYFTLEEPDMRLMHEEAYGYYYTAPDAEMKGIHSIQLYAIANPEEDSITNYVVAQYNKQSPYTKLAVKTVNGYLWRGFAKKLGNVYVYYWYTENQGKFFELSIQSFDQDDSLYVDVLEDAQ